MMRRRHIVLTCLLAATVAYAIGARGTDPAITPEMVVSAQSLAALEFTASEIDSMLQDLEEYRDAYGQIRAVVPGNGVPPALVFRVDASPDGGHRAGPLGTGERRHTSVPDDVEELAFYSVRDLSALIAERKLTSVALTKMYLERLKEYGRELECVVTLTEERALEQARRADEEIAAGKYRGPLHGIPWGAKDLLAVDGYPTTWGATPYREQVIEETATVVRKLDEAGAVLVAKLTLGALAWGDVWFGGTTRNPWDIEQGSSGSSAGSASATSAGLVAFAIGTETWGSIVSPCTRCGVTGLRPTFGRVSRSGAMALSWSMDKIGPICRTVEDCAIVFDAIRGSDGRDMTVVDAPFAYDPVVDLSGLRVGFLESAFEADYANRASDLATLETLRGLGIALEPIELPDYPVDALPLILTAEAAAAFDELTRSNRDDELVRQIRNAWPNVLRAARFIPAVEYIQANRVRTLIMREMEKLDVDVWVAPSFGGDNLLLTNLTGHPCVVLPNGFDKDGHPVSITFMGKLFGEADLLAVASAYQSSTNFHEQHPPRYR